MDEVAELQKVKDKEIETQTEKTTTNAKTTVNDSLSDIVSRTSEGIDSITELVSAKSPEVENAVTDLCGVAVEGFKKSLGIDAQGKSKVFATIGYSIPQGIAEGIHDGQAIVTDAVRQVIEKSISEIDFGGLSDTIVSKINKELGGLMD